MIIFFYGTDTFRLKQLRDAAIKKHQKNTPVSLFFLDTKEDQERLEIALKNNGLFAVKEIFAVGDPFEASNLEDWLKTSDIAKDKERLLMLSQAGSELELKKKSKTLLAFLKKHSALVEQCIDLSDVELSAWVVKHAKHLGFTITRPDAQFLIACVSDADRTKKAANRDRTWRLHQELTKLANYKAGDKDATISKDDITSLILPTTDTAIFPLVDAFAARKPVDAFVMLARQLANGADPFFIFSMITYQFRNLLKIKSMADSRIAPDAIAAKSKLHPFVARKTLQQSASYQLSDLKRLFIKLHDLEQQAKSGITDMSDGLYSFAFSLGR